MVDRIGPKPLVPPVTPPEPPAQPRQADKEGNQNEKPDEEGAEENTERKTPDVRGQTYGSRGKLEKILPEGTLDTDDTHTTHVAPPEDEPGQAVDKKA